MDHSSLDADASIVRRPRLAGLARRQLTAALRRAGIELDGTHPWDPHVVDERVFARVLMFGTLGAGDAYVDGQWECAGLDELASRVSRAHLDDHWGVSAALGELAARVLNRQTPAQARRNSVAHYEQGDDLFRLMLGRTMTYSCAYWRDAATLDEAQDAKHELICRKLQLARGQRLLDVGCGWGELARYAAERYGVNVVGITVSDAQARGARDRCRGLPVDIRVQDYRSLTGRFDRVVSVGMFEHVGVANYDAFFETIRRVLAAEGIFLLHTIGSHSSSYAIDPWIDRHIFPNANLPSPSQITRAAAARLVLEDWHNFGADYDRTLLAWHANVVSNWDVLRNRHDERFRRMWRYYLLTCAGMFRARKIQLWQVVFSSRGVRGGYSRVGA